MTKLSNFENNKPLNYVWKINILHQEKACRTWKYDTVISSGQGLLACARLCCRHHIVFVTVQLSLLYKVQMYTFYWNWQLKKFKRPRFCWYFQKFVTSSLYFDLIVVVAEKLRNCNFQWPGFVCICNIICPCSVYQEFGTLNSSLHFGQVFLLGVVID